MRGGRRRAPTLLAWLAAASAVPAVEETTRPRRPSEHLHHATSRSRRDATDPRRRPDSRGLAESTSSADAMIERARRSFDHDLDAAKNHRPEAAVWLPPHRSSKVTAGPPGPLPPIVQWGQPRSGSTFQFTLLCLIAKVRGNGTSPGPTCSFAQTLSADVLQPNTVFKTHHRPKATSGYSLFVSHGDERLETSGLPEPVVVQTLARNQDLLNEVDRYRAAFGLSPDETEQILGYMRYWSILRRCCGLQQSKYNRLRLHGCAVPIAVDSSEFPMCEAYNLTAVEVLFTQTRLYSHGLMKYNPPDHASLTARSILGYIP